MGFVDSALRSASAESDSFLASGLRSIFACADTDENGNVTWEEFEQQLANPAMMTYFKTIDLDISEARGLFKLLDFDDSGSINAEEFIMGTLRMRGTARAIDLATLMYETKRMHVHLLDIESRLG